MKKKIASVNHVPWRTRVLLLRASSTPSTENSEWIQYVNCIEYRQKDLLQSLPSIMIAIYEHQILWSCGEWYLQE